MSQAYRDLVWALTSPPLMAQTNGWALAKPPDTSVRTWLKEIEANPELLESYVADVHASRLGLYYEILIKFFLEYHPDYELLMHNHPVFQARRTMGAFDFIYKHKDKTIHRESAVKFYLGIPQEDANPYSDWSHWWGPNKVDRLDKKLHRLIDHQIPLSDTVEATEMLAQENIYVDAKEIDLKGYLCYPLNQEMPSPFESNPQHLRAAWLTLSEMTTLPKRCYWEILPRLRWLSPARCQEKPKLTTAPLLKKVHRHFKRHHTPLLVCRLNKQTNAYVEAERFFVTPDSWLERGPS